MTCAHCLRGDAQELDISHHHIRNVLRHFRHIHQLTISGGEPSLNVKAIHYILKQLKRFGVHIYRFHIITNGSLSSMSEDFIKVCSELYEYQEDDELESHMLIMSDDRFHDSHYRKQVIAALGDYPFFGQRGQAKSIFLIHEGRCKNGYQEPIHPIYLSPENYVYGDLYLNAEGKILSSCNISYLRQSDFALCHSGNLSSYLKSTLQKRKTKS